MTVQTYDIGKPYFVIAHHVTHKSFNRMHADGLPQKLGFRGAFVLGVALYGNMTRALVSRLGEEWLSRAVIEAKFLKPVCDGDRLRIETQLIAGREKERAFSVQMFNETVNNELSAVMESAVPDPFPESDPTSQLQPNEWEGPVTQRRTWDTVITGKAYRSFKHTLRAEDNTYWKGVLGDDVGIYEQGGHAPIHPSHVLRQVQMGYNNQFIGDNAVHSSTRAVIHKMLCVGDEVTLLTVPLSKWEKKQNHWLTTYCAVKRGEEVCAEIFHTQIIKLRGAEALMADKP